MHETEASAQTVNPQMVDFRYLTTLLGILNVIQLVTMRYYLVMMRRLLFYSAAKITRN